MEMTLAFTYLKKFGPCFFLNCDKRLDLKAMVRRISILLLERSTKLSKSRTPLRTLVAKTLYLATIKQ